MDIFNKVYDFLDSFSGTLTYNYIFLFSVGLFVIVALGVLFSTSKAYESKLVKAVDMFNAYFAQYPQINDETLVTFNNKMKSNKVPRLLRKQWQQYVLYREGKASDYMSFELCVSEPIKNSSYKRDITTLNILSYIIILLSLVFNLFESYELELYSILRHCLVTPFVVLLLNFVVTIFLNVRHNAIVTDLYTSYQYFEVNIDKATKTLPEYIDYEVLFDREEIKQGIPILYAYLQKRADEEQKELERARLKNVEHEKFNFDASGVESALVLERAMQEAENYIAERKKLMQDIEQINSDIAQEDLNFREITKEYQRQMQVSKETFANFKSQLEEETSSISINYLKKQQQQELDRQRNLERDYDTASDRHKKVNDEYLAELKAVEEEISDARKSLEEAMMNEFATYSAKVYKEAEKVAVERQQSKTDKLKDEIQSLEETIVSKENELNNLYENKQAIDEKINAITDKVGEAIKVSVDDKTADQSKKKKANKKLEEIKEKVGKAKDEEGSDESFNINVNDTQNQEEQDEDSGDIFGNSFFSEPETTVSEEPEYEYRPPVMVDEPVKQSQDDEEGSDDGEDVFDFDEENDDFEFKFEDEDEFAEDEEENQSQSLEEPEYQYRPPVMVDEQDSESNSEEDSEDDFDFYFEEDETDKDSVEEGETTEPAVSTTEVESKPKGKRGRPRKEVVEKKSTGRRPGRPRKTEAKVEEKPKKKPGRPKKTTTATEPVKKKGRGRPRKSETVTTAKVKKGRGRPRKTVETKTIAKKKGPGRPKKVVAQPVKQETGKRRGRPRKTEMDSRAVDLDKVLKEINDAIAIENSKIEKSKKALEKKTKICKRK